jgi:hypothetical protein
VILILGVTGYLTRFNIVFANLMIGTVVTAIALSKGGRAMRSISFRGTLALVRREPQVTFALLAACFGFTWYVMLAIFFSPVGYDDFAYHLPGAAFALQNSSLIPIALPPRLLAINYFPQLSEFLSIWCFLLLGRDSMIIIWQGGIYLYFVTACFVLCRACGCTRTGTLFGVSLAAVTPTLLAQILSSYNDVCVAAFFSAALAFAVIAGRDSRRIYLLGLALSCGGLLSAKLSTPLLVGVAIGVFIAQSVTQRFRPVALLWSIVFVILIATALGGYWYTRNTLLYGNPLYPFVIHFAGITFSGTAMPLSPTFLNPELGRLPLFERLWGLWMEQKSHYGYWFYNYESAYTGFGPIWFIVGIPSIVGAMLLSACKQQWTALAIFALTISAYLGFQGNMSVRYTLFILPVMGLGIAMMFDQLRQSRQCKDNKIRAGVARGSLLIVQSLGTVLAFLTVGLMLFAVKEPAVILKQIRGPIASRELESPVFGVFSSARKNIPKDSVVVFDESVDFIYPLWRPDFKNIVCFVSSAQPMERWSSKAAALRARYVFAKVGPTIPAEVRSPLAGWIALHPSSFKLVASVPNYGELYELL